ncbi:MAG: UDP-N-acetylmuramoyl-tripeptide--D-alanyl-D-alanine ligase [Proteobacteria bacterium]|nr:UDP-N-acetylmuramoyl-tripeptide--D-alanyl-D-alanine ligase [Pseudomonadota bacterium]
MTLWTKSEIIEALSEELIEQNIPDNFEVDEVLIDSRKTSKNGLFIALKGEKNDGHDFIDQAITNGCKTILIDKPNSNPQQIKILVRDTFTSLYKLAKFARKRSKAKIIGLTGSVGKTGTKDMLELAFKTQGKTFATLGNLNNHFGVPLSLCNFPRDCDYGIFEMGMNHAGEIEPLSKLVKPHLAIITNVGPVHIEFFKNEEGIAAAKAEIFSGLIEEKIALINFDNPHFEFLKQRSQGLKMFSFGKKNGANYQILSNSIEAKLANGKNISYQINSQHPAIIFNSIIVVACLDLLGSDFEKGISALKNLQNKEGRGKIIEWNGIPIIDESYNASLPSMRAGLEYASNQKKFLGKKRVVALLGDMLELGEKSAEIHEKTVNLLSEFNIDFAVLVGEKMSAAAKNLPKNSYQTFSNSSSASLAIKDLLRDGDILYVKGSRGMKMENIIKGLTSVH